MSCSYLLSTSGIAALLLSGYAAQAADTTELAGEIDRIVGEAVGESGPGCAVGLIEGGAVTLRKGYGLASVEFNIPLGPETVLNVGSLSKHFTALSALLAVRAGAFSFEDDIRTYVPEMQEHDSTIRIRHVVHHTSGIQSLGALIFFAGVREPLLTMKQKLDMITAQKHLSFTTGTNWEYSNSGYFLLGEIIARASNSTLRDFSRQNIFEPLGMSATQFVEDDNLLIPNMAAGYSVNSDGKISRQYPALARGGRGGMVTSVDDMIKYDANLRDNILDDGADDLLDVMTTAGTYDDGSEMSTAYGFGLFVGDRMGHPVYWHGGAIPGFNTFFAHFTNQDVSIVMLCNSGNIVGQVNGQIADLISGITEEDMDAGGGNTGPSNNAEQPEPPQIPPDELHAYAGSYQNDSLDVRHRIRIEDDKLVLSIGPFGRTLVLEPSEGDRMRAVVRSDDGSPGFQAGSVEFQKTGNGMVSGYTFSIGRAQKLVYHKDGVSR